MEAVLRTAIRVAIQDDAFREIFLEKDRIRVAFPNLNGGVSFFLARFFAMASLFLVFSFQ
jgi:hypothetical protein